MKVSILIPHYKTPKTTAYSVWKFLENVGKHDVEIIVINNSYGDNSIESLSVFGDRIKIWNHITDKISSHGIALDVAMGFVKNEIVITAESDSFPENSDWLNYYESLVDAGYDSAASVLQLSGGRYGHPAGAFYKRSVWQECKNYCDNIEYSYFPNMSRFGGFDCHLMVHQSILDKVLDNTDDWIELASGYRGLTKDDKLQERDWYKPVVSVFHNGMGRLNEYLQTYGQRNEISEVPYTLLTNKPKIVNRIGLEPGQHFYYWMLANGYKIFSIPTETKWLSNRDGQQQEYTLNEAGFRHIWAGSSYLDMRNGVMNDVYEFKKKQIENLYNQLPAQYKK